MATRGKRGGTGRKEGKTWKGKEEIEGRKHPFTSPPQKKILVTALL